MPKEITFAYVCSKTFDQLRGGTVRRYCDFCRTEVINLDALSEEAGLKLFEEASRTGVVPCVSATVWPEGALACSSRPPQPRATAGIPRMEDSRSYARRLREIKEERRKKE